MKVPLSWLKEYVEIDVTPEVLESKLFSCGFEVEDVNHFGSNLNKVVVCKILTIEKHPNADKLSVTQVDAGEYGKLQIVTNAKNINVGDLVPLAVNGATLFNGEKIFDGELRGVKSNGMFCGGEELGINDDFYSGASVNGVLVFHDDFMLGMEVKDALNIKDIIFDINVTANRPDCQSIYGIAREVAAVLNKKIKPIPTAYITKKNVSTKKEVAVNVIANDLCPKYMINCVKNVRIEQSPVWLKKRLFSVGVRSINNIVDITNYILFELGHPMHAFDLNDVEGQVLTVRRALDGEKIVTLDNKEWTLNNNNLVICDKTKPIDLAGIMGGQNSEIKDNTESVLFESAVFKRDNIRRSARMLGQSTNASSRFEKGVDAWTANLALKRAMNLVNELNAGDIACDYIDIKVKNEEQKVIETKISKINGVLGIVVPTEEIENILKKLGFYTNIEGDDIQITVPGYREDIEGYQDIAEEVIREYGYSHLVPTMLNKASVTNGGENIHQKDTDTLKNLLCSLGCNEIISYSFVSEKENDLFELTEEFTKNGRVKIKNPLGEEVSNMRSVLFPSMIYTVQRNLNRKNLSGRLFELAKVYIPKQLPVEELPVEKEKLCISVFGQGEDFWTVKGILEDIFDKMAKNTNFEYVQTDLPFMHPTRTATVFADGENIGFIGQFNPQLAENLGIEQDIYIAELDIDKLKKHYDNKVLFKNIPKYPSIERDIALITDKNTKYSDIYNCIKENGGEILKEIKLFDIYEGNQIAEGKKSMAFNLRYNGGDRTLPSEEADDSINNILTALKGKYNIELR